jgi:DNA-binding NarL/FixJ family response regulator
MKTPAIAMIDDDKIVRDSVCTFIDLKSNFSIHDTFSNAEDFLIHSFKTEPSILILDVGLPGMSGTEAIPHILLKYPNLDIIMLTTYEEEDVILKALCSEACSYISKRAGLKAIAEAIEIVANGGSYMSPRIAKEITRHFFANKKLPQ